MRSHLFAEHSVDGRIPTAELVHYRLVIGHLGFVLLVTAVQSRAAAQITIGWRGVPRRSGLR